MKIIIDRFEEEVAICEKSDYSIIKIEKSKLPIDAKEGSILIINNDEIIIDNKASENKKNKLKNFMENIFRES